MMRQVLVITSLLSLCSAQLCFDELEVAGACTAGTDLGLKLMSALYQCDAGNTYTRQETSQDWHDVLTNRRLERQSYCPSVQELEADFHQYMSCKSSYLRKIIFLSANRNETESDRSLGKGAKYKKKFDICNTLV